jgi:hypothetical protein
VAGGAQPAVLWAPREPGADRAAERQQQVALADLLGLTRLPGERPSVSLAAPPGWPAGQCRGRAPSSPRSCGFSRSCPRPAFRCRFSPIRSWATRCTYAELSGISIHQLITGSDGDDAVTTARFTWDGTDLLPDDQQFG